MKLLLLVKTLQQSIKLLCTSHWTRIITNIICIKHQPLVYENITTKTSAKILSIQVGKIYNLLDSCFNEGIVFVRTSNDYIYTKPAYQSPSRQLMMVTNPIKLQRNFGDFKTISMHPNIINCFVNRSIFFFPTRNHFSKIYQ